MGSLRTFPKCWVAEDQETYWLKSEIGDGSPPLALQQLPAKGRYWIDEDHRLFPIEGLTPIATLPTLEWTPIASFVSIELPIAALPAQVTEKVSVQLIRSTEQQEANFLLLPWQLWQDYALATSNIRLKPLSFAVSQEAQVMVYGRPIPSLPGQLFWQTQQVLLPAGWKFKYSIIAGVLSSAYLKGKSGLLLYTSEQLFILPPIEQFVEASRSAIRKTKEHLNKIV